MTSSFGGYAIRICSSSTVGPTLVAGRIYCVNQGMAFRAFDAVSRTIYADNIERRYSLALAIDTRWPSRER